MTTRAGFYVVLEEEKEWGTLWGGISEKLPNVWLHCEIRKWGLSQAIECRKIWPSFLAQLKSLGFSTAHSSVPDSDRKLLKWQKMFGMCEVNRNNGIVLFERKL